MSAMRNPNTWIFGTAGVAVVSLGALGVWNGIQDNKLIDTTNELNVDTTETVAQIEEIKVDFNELCLVGVSARIENSKAVLRQKTVLAGVELPDSADKEYRLTGSIPFETSVCLEPVEVTGTYDPNTGERQLFLGSENMSVRAERGLKSTFVPEGNGWANIGDSVSSLTQVFTKEENQAGAAQEAAKVRNTLENTSAAYAASVAKGCTLKTFESNPDLAQAWGYKLGEVATNFLNIDRAEGDKLGPADIDIIVDGIELWPNNETNPEMTPFSRMNFIDAPGESLSELLANKELGDLDIDESSVDKGNENMCVVSDEVQELIDGLAQTNAEESATEIPTPESVEAQ